MKCAFLGLASMSSLLLLGCVTPMPPPAGRTSINNSARASALPCLDLTHNNAGVIYESRLVMNGQTGMMRTRFFDTSNNRAADVGQTMKLGSSAHGTLILGYNPVYFGTSTPYPNYSPDNFLFSIKPNGSYVFATCDDARNCSPVSARACRQ